MLDLTAVVICLSFGRRNIADRLKQSIMIEPRDPLERCQFDGFLGLPWAATGNDFRLAQTVDGFGERVVIAVALAADRGLDPRLSEALRVANRDALGVTVAMMDPRVAIRLAKGEKRGQAVRRDRRYI